MLAAASLGAIFTSASPDFGVQGVLDRFGQTEPKVLVACDGYYYGGKTVDVPRQARRDRRQLPSVKRVVVVPYVHREHDLSHVPHARVLADFVAPFHVDDIPFACCPSTIRSTSCTPRAPPACPKCIVHCAGGALLQHLKEHKLHGDVKPGDRCSTSPPAAG